MCIRETSWCKHVGPCWELAREKGEEGEEEEGIGQSVRGGRRGKGLNQPGAKETEKEKRDRHREEEGDPSPLFSSTEPQAEPRRHRGLKPQQTLPLAATSPWCRATDAQGG